MQTGFYNATAGMVAQVGRLDTISHNLANINTNGFKRSDLVFGDYLRLSKETRDMDNEINDIPDHTKDGAKFLHRAISKSPHITEEYTDYQIGHIERTDSSLDFALTKENLFFLVSTPSGVRLTRDGSFSINEQGLLVSKDGFPVLSSAYGNGVAEKDSYIKIPESTTISSDEDGVLSAVAEDGSFVAIDRLNVSQVENLSYLEKEGNNFFRLDKLDDINFVESSKAVRQGFVEKSNVNAVSEMTAMIETQRLFDMYQKVIKTHMDDLNSDAINKLAKVSK